MPNFEKYLVAEKEKEYRERCEKYIWSCVPDKKLFHREDYQSKYMIDIAAKKAEKWEHASQSLNQLLKQSGGSATVDDKKESAPKPILKGENSVAKLAKASVLLSKDKGPSRKDLDELYRVRVDQIEPNNLDLTKMYQDCVPPEAKILEDFLNNQKKDKDSKDSTNTSEDMTKK